MSEVDEADEMANNTIATGAVAALMSGVAHRSTVTSLATVDGGPPNQLVVTFSFLNSPYLITVERVRE